MGPSTLKHTPSSSFLGWQRQTNTNSWEPAWRIQISFIRGHEQGIRLHHGGELALAIQHAADGVESFGPPEEISQLRSISSRLSTGEGLWALSCIQKPVKGWEMAAGPFWLDLGTFNTATKLTNHFWNFAFIMGSCPPSLSGPDAFCHESWGMFFHVSSRSACFSCVFTTTMARARPNDFILGFMFLVGERWN